ncbi:MAG: gamma-glutamyl-gamma-aminobutyrate hydrolase family protein [Terriglobales bacterium]
MPPRIAIPHPHSAQPEYVAKVFPQYASAVAVAGGEPVEIGLDLSNHAIARLATTCDGVLLPGSRADINPEKYGAARNPRTAPDDPLRDNADELLLQDAFNMRKPLLGICFGLQSLNVWRTGTLLQHITSEVPHSGNTHDPAPPHRVVVDPASRLGAIVGDAAVRTEHGLELMVNSSHHQAAAAIGDGLRAVAWCPDDAVIEAIEGTGEQWVIAVQWHPERMTQDAAAQALFRSFIQAARRWRERRSTPDFESIRSSS